MTMASMRFSGKTILVTGAANGIGMVTAEQFAREGGLVTATDINMAELTAAFTPLIEAGLAIELLEQDVTKQEAWAKTIDYIKQRHGKLDVLFNNAGSADFASLSETTLEQWRHVNALNLDSVFFGMQAAIDVMKDTGGAIVNNASIASFFGEPLLSAYCSTKAGVGALTRTAAVECARKGYKIRINSIHPGYTDTRLVGTLLDSLGDKQQAFTESTLSKVPMGRLAEPLEIARPVLFLASDDASFMTGSGLVVDGGYLAE